MNRCHRQSIRRLSCLILACAALNATGQKGLMHEWVVEAESAMAGKVGATKGDLPAVFQGSPRLELSDGFPCLEFNGKDTSLLISGDHSMVRLPQRSFTLEVWCRVDRQTNWGGLISCIQDDGGQEAGWLLGLRGDRFVLALATEGSNDGDGKLTYMTSSKQIKFGEWAHVVGTYNGELMQLFVNGESMASSKAQEGKIHYPKKTPLELAAYHDTNEYFRLSGAMHSAAVFSRPLNAATIRKRFNTRKSKMPKPRKMTVKAITQAELAPAIKKGIAWLYRTQEPDGSWRGEGSGQFFGNTALAAYTLVKCGVPRSHPRIQTAISLLRSRKLVTTYDVGCALMAYSAMQDPELKPYIEEYAEYLVKICGNGRKTTGGRWGYPYHIGNSEALEYWDLSNTQYALLGLRAARQVGVEKGNVTFWRRVAADLAADSKAYGGWGYRRGTNTGSMTVAGIASLIICQEALGKHAGRKTAALCKAGITRGLEWLGEHWSVSSNPEKTGNGWLLYYLYGMERVGSFLNTHLLAGHDWHSEGSRVVLKRQNANGDWGGNDYDTCFALMFLTRGSRVSGKNTVSIALASEDGDVVIGARPESPVLAWIKRISPELKKELTGATKLKWRVNDLPLKGEMSFSIDNLLDEKTFLRHRPKENGPLTLQGTIIHDGKEYLSNILELSIDNVDVAPYQEARAAHSTNLLDSRAHIVASSSLSDNWTAENVVDGWYSKGWFCKEGDRSLWIRVILPNARRANEIRLAQTASYGGNHTKWRRARDISVSINGRKPFKATLKDNSLLIQSIRFPTTLVKSIRIKPTSFYEGWQKKSFTAGFKEIELFLR